MINLCTNCNTYNPKKEVTSDGSAVICPNCGHQRPFERKPLFIVTGASSVGKTTACSALYDMLDNYVVMESDILWHDIYNTPEDNYRAYRETWLRLCKNINVPVVLCGCAVPEQFEDCIERRYFKEIHYLSLVCDDDALKSRLDGDKRYDNSPDYKITSRDFNKWLTENSAHTAPAMSVLDTTGLNPLEVAEHIKKWIESKSLKLM